VVKTRRPYGYRLYWLSHTQHSPIRTIDCKPGHEFEIKTDNTSGHGTLPPSRHRDDMTFQYRAIGQSKIAIRDGLYDGILRILADCLRPKTRGQSRSITAAYTNSQENFVVLTQENVQTICDLIRPHYKRGHRHNICYTLSGVFHKSAVDVDCASNVLRLLGVNDEEVKNRLTVVATYKKNRKEVNGYNAFYTTLQNATGDDSIAKNVLASVDRIVNHKGRGKEKENSHSLLKKLLQQFTFKTIRDTEEVYYYDETKGVYRSLAETVIKEQLEILCPTIRTYEVKEIINKIISRTYVERTVFDKDPNIHNLKNGLLNILTGKFSSHTPNYLSFVQLPINYDPNAKCPNILRFLGQVLQPSDVFTALQIFGYCLEKSVKYEKAFLLEGDEGDNGKSTFTKLLEHFLGRENVSHSSLQELDNDRFAKADLYGKLANICSDLQSKKLSHTGNFKTLVSGDIIRAQRKHGRPFDFSSIAKMIFSTNKIPESDDQTNAFFKRWIILHFYRIFRGEEKDTNLIEKLTTEEELSGLLNLALIALKQLKKDDEFIHADDIETTKREYNENANSVDVFLANNCHVDITDRNRYVMPKDLYRNYEQFCAVNNLTPVSINVFGARLKARGFAKERLLQDGQRVYRYIGISPA
jgi:P4 family phage/plasmid primase-like protien